MNEISNSVSNYTISMARECVIRFHKPCESEKFCCQLLTYQEKVVSL